MPIPPTNLKTEGFTLKLNASNEFRPHLRWRNLKTQQSPLILGFVFDKTWAGSNRSQKAPFLKCFLFTPENEKPTVSNSFGLKSLFEKHPFRDGFIISVDGSPNRINKV